MEKQPKLHIIGVLHGDISSREDAPKNYSESEIIGGLMRSGRNISNRKIYWYISWLAEIIFYPLLAS